MKASELISHLQTLINKHGDKDIVLQVIDHTDWIYNFDFPGVELDEVYDTESDYEDEWFDGEYFVISKSI
jgi:hypothetical protein